MRNQLLKIHEAATLKLFFSSLQDNLKEVGIVEPPRANVDEMDMSVRIVRELHNDFANSR